MDRSFQPDVTGKSNEVYFTWSCAACLLGFPFECFTNNSNHNRSTRDDCCPIYRQHDCRRDDYRICWLHDCCFK